jgi:hypothetical protein
LLLEYFPTAFPYLLSKFRINAFLFTVHCNAEKQNVMSEPLCITVLERAGQTGMGRTDRNMQDR